MLTTTVLIASQVVSTIDPQAEVGRADARPLAVASQAEQLETVTLNIEGTERRMLVRIPAGNSTNPKPVVFGFHGHGGNMRNAARSFGFHKLWDEAVVIYMEGLPTIGITDPEGKKNGWQKIEGDYDNRDLKFFDKANSWIHSKTTVDDKRIFCTGHSNGGAFTYLLWSSHPGLLRAIAPSAAGGRAAYGKDPITMLHVSGSEDKVVSFELQKRTIERVKRVNECSTEGTEWIPGATRWESKTNHPVTHYVYPGSHSLPENVPGIIVKFFKEQM